MYKLILFLFLFLFLSLCTSQVELPNPPQTSKFCYVTMLSGIDTSYKYRGFLYNTIIMKKSLDGFGSKADMIVLIGYTNQEEKSLFIDDINLLKKNKIRIYELERLLSPDTPFDSFSEMALLKITPYSFISYEKFQFLDGDIMPIASLDCFFEYNNNVFTIGTASPLNSGWLLGIPNITTYKYLRHQAYIRLTSNWKEKGYWGGLGLPPSLPLSGQKSFIKDWTFNGGDMDQGLFAHYFILSEGNTIIYDTKIKNKYWYGKGFYNEPVMPYSSKTEICMNKMPNNLFFHFTGRSKPWMNKDLQTVIAKNNYKSPDDAFLDKSALIFKNEPYLMMWVVEFDKLLLPGLAAKDLKPNTFTSPLGYFSDKLDVFKQKK